MCLPFTTQLTCFSINHQVPKESRCDYLTSLQIYCHLKDNTSWTLINANLNLDTIIIRPLEPGIYIMKMILTNNQGVKSESESHYVVIKDKYLIGNNI